MWKTIAYDDEIYTSLIIVSEFWKTIRIFMEAYLSGTASTFSGCLHVLSLAIRNYSFSDWCIKCTLKIWGVQEKFFGYLKMGRENFQNSEHAQEKFSEI